MKTPDKAKARKASRFRLGVVERAAGAGSVNLAKALNRVGAPQSALSLLDKTAKFSPSSAERLEELKRANEKVEGPDRSRASQVKLLKSWANEKARRGDLTGVLVLQAELEKLRAECSRGVGNLIGHEMRLPMRRKKLLAHINKAQKIHPDSVYLRHLETLCRVSDGDYQAIGDELFNQIMEFDLPDAMDRKQLIVRKRDFEQLKQCWRIADEVARHDMGWATENEAYQAKTRFEARSTIHEGKLVRRVFSFKDSLLQARMHQSYLDACCREFDAVEDLSSRLQCIQDMLLFGVRRISNYGFAFETACDRMNAIRNEWEPLIDPEATNDDMPPHVVIQTLNRTLSVLRILRMDRDVRTIKAGLARLASHCDFKTTRWMIGATLTNEPGWSDIAEGLMRPLSAKPQSERDVRAFFTWANNEQRFKAAESFFNKLPKQLKFSHGSMNYVKILQRQGQFQNARWLANGIHNEYLRHPTRLNALNSWKLLERIRELKFLAETAGYYSSVPQPKDPKGVIFIAARNVDQLRRCPLTVLMTMKKRGWAVIPIVAGVLPVEKTGIKELDEINGCILPDLRLSARAKRIFKDVSNFHCDVAKGELSWNGIDLSHTIWEDAAINRRRFHVDFSCPLLQAYLGRLSDWTRLQAITLQRISDVMEFKQIPAGIMSFFSYRLPDALIRFYCEKYGDPEKLFCLITANGYQNYFDNFASPISTRCVVRNVTQYPQVRSASFPIPEFFENFYQQEINRAPEVFERVQEITTWKRSTAGQSSVSEATTKADERIRAWRASGGKVACAFGKVVFDSGVPFDGGTVHANMKEWINHCLDAVRGTNTLLLMKPHPHEINNLIATFPTEYFADLIDVEIPENAIMLEHRSFDIHDLKSRIDLGLIYNGTTAIELGLLDIPCLLSGHFAPIDYPIGHTVPQSREEFESYLRFEAEPQKPSDLKYKAAMWLDYMSSDTFTIDYRYHARSLTNRVVYPPWWIKEDIDGFIKSGDPNVETLTDRALGLLPEPGGRLRGPVDETGPPFQELSGTGDGPPMIGP